MQARQTPPAGSSLLSQVNWRQLSVLASRELSNRENHAPVVSAFRWWARRPHSVMGALLDAAARRYGDELTVSDPFSGGGTVTFEAASRGLKAYAQDLYPWPARGLASALQACTAQDLSRASDAVLAALEPLRSRYRTSDGRELSHVIRVRSAYCRQCDRRHFQFPTALVSLASRGLGEQYAYFGCSACGAIAKRRKTVSTFKCGSCATTTAADRQGKGCPGCASEDGTDVQWHAVLVQELFLDQHGRWRAVLRPHQAGDPTDDNSAKGLEGLTGAIPAGKETNRLLANGFEEWGALYTARQATTLVAALNAVRALDAPQAVKDRLAFAVLGAAEMPAFLSRWDRFHLKAFEGMANHRYTTTPLCVETNLLSPVGRGTLRRRLESAALSLQWLIDAGGRLPKVATTVAGKLGRKRTDWDVLVTTGSSTSQELRTGSVDLVLTDPPYFGDVQYGELARLLHTWLTIYDPTVQVDESLEAVPNSTRGVSATDYERAIAACFKECARTLKPGGTLVLTFHNKKLAAWKALAGAIGRAGLGVRALAVVKSENGADHCKRDVAAMLHDLVIECVPVGGAPKEPRLEFKVKSVVEKNLAAVGLALAECARHRRAHELSATYRGHLARLKSSTSLIE